MPHRAGGAKPAEPARHGCLGAHPREAWMPSNGTGAVSVNRAANKGGGGQDGRTGPPAGGPAGAARRAAGPPALAGGGAEAAEPPWQGCLGEHPR